MTAHRPAAAGTLLACVAALAVVVGTQSAAAAGAEPGATGRANTPANLPATTADAGRAAPPRTVAPDTQHPTDAAEGGSSSSAADGDSSSSAVERPPAPRDPIEDDPILPPGSSRRQRRAAGDGGIPLGLSGDEKDSADSARTRGTTSLLWKSLSGLAIVCGLMVVGVVLLKRVVPATQRGGNSDGLSVLGRAYVAPKASLFLVKVGRRILVVGQTPAGITRVAEIDDPEEVEQVAARCERARSASITSSFRHLLGQGLASHWRFGRASGVEPRDLDTETDESRIGNRESGIGNRPAATSVDAESEIQDPRSKIQNPQADAEVGLIRQELDLILGKVRSWRAEGGSDGSRESGIGSRELGVGSRESTIRNPKSKIQLPDS